MLRSTTPTRPTWRHTSSACWFPSRQRSRRPQQPNRRTGQLWRASASGQPHQPPSARRLAKGAQPPAATGNARAHPSPTTTSTTTSSTTAAAGGGGGRKWGRHVPSRGGPPPPEQGAQWQRPTSPQLTCSAPTPPRRRTPPNLHRSRRQPRPQPRGQRPQRLPSKRMRHGRWGGVPASAPWVSGGRRGGRSPGSGASQSSPRQRSKGPHSRTQYRTR